MPDDSGLRPCRPTPARARARRARCGTGVNNIVHSSGVRSNRIVNRVPTPPGDTYGPYFALISLWVMNTTTLTRRPPTVRPRYQLEAGVAPSVDVATSENDICLEEINQMSRHVATFA